MIWISKICQFRNSPSPIECDTKSEVTSNIERLKNYLMYLWYLQYGYEQDPKQLSYWILLSTPPATTSALPVVREKDSIAGDRPHALLHARGGGGVQGQAAGQDLVVVLHAVRQVLLSRHAKARQQRACKCEFGIIKPLETNTIDLGTGTVKQCCGSALWWCGSGSCLSLWCGSES